MRNTIIIFVMLTAGLFSCRQGRKSAPNTFYGKYVYSHYEYTDSIGKRLIIQNGFPRGEPYTAPNGKQCFKVIFWTRIINETDSPMELKIDFPVDAYEIPSLPGNYYKVLIPRDTMTIDKVSLYDYGLTGIKAFLDTSIDNPSSLKRTINPKDSSGFCVIILGFAGKSDGTTRTELSLKGQDLFYRMKIDGSRSHSKSSDTELNCGRINLKNLVLQE